MLSYSVQDFSNFFVLQPHFEANTSTRPHYRYINLHSKDAQKLTTQLTFGLSVIENIFWHKNKVKLN